MANGKTKVRKIQRDYTNDKQLKAIAIFKRNVRKGKYQSNKDVLIEAGYPPKYASTKSTKIVKSKTFQQLLDKHIPEATLTRKHKELLKASTVLADYEFSVDLTDAEIKHIIERVPNCKFIRTNRTTTFDKKYVTAYYYKPDNATQLKSLELGYKVRKKLMNESGDGEGEFSEEIKAVIVRIRKALPQAGQ